jgi:transposase
VIGPTGQVRVLVASKPVDFRKGMEGLAALVKEQLRTDPFSGASTCSAPSAPIGSS